MDPDPNLPWRVLEAPSTPEPGAAAATSTVAEKASAPPPTAAAVLTSPLARWIAVGLGVVACVVIAVALAATGGSGEGVQVHTAAVPSGAVAATSPGSIVVEIAGAVDRPGVYRLPPGSRVADAVAAAGGYGPRVDTARTARDLDLVAALADGARIRVASRDDPPPTPAASGADPAAPGAPIDLTTATADQLDTLPGIGPVTAAKIIAARDEAPFATVDDLRARGVLGEKTFEAIRELVTVP